VGWQDLLLFVSLFALASLDNLQKLVAYIFVVVLALFESIEITKEFDFVVLSVDH
jgi:hypothetical protein